MAEPIITTVIPTFKRPTLLKRAIESVLTQSFKSLVVCVYDNASGDETEEVVKTLANRDSRVLYFKNSQNIGPVANMIQGVKAVNTPFYSLLNDDDFLLPTFYENAINAFKSFPNAEFVCSKTIVIDLIDKKLQFCNQNWLPGFYEPSNDIVSKMYLSYFVQTGVLLSTSLREAIGSFEPSGSDSLYMTIAATVFPFVVLNNYGAVVTLHENAYSIVGEGIVKENVQTLYEHLLSTLSNVMNISVPPERKIHLLMYILKSYQQHFDTKKLNYLMSRNHEDSINNIICLPSLITNRGLVAKFYDLFPEKTHSWVTQFFKLTRFLKRVLGRESKIGWIDLPKDAYTLLDGHNSDISTLVPYLKLKS
ncbi:MAG: glycosyltransferase family 2 protein [Methylococcaceae bacterium]|nr:glycosyltransferase family 2 protein [Methylococcaceae bacterium]